MRAVAAVPTEGKRFLTHENKPPLSSKMKSRVLEESWENITVNMTTSCFLLVFQDDKKRPLASDDHFFEIVCDCLLWVSE